MHISAKKILSSFFILFLCVIVTRTAESVTLPSLNKSKIRHTISPGKSEFGEIVVDNQTSETRAMRVYLSDWQYLPSGDGTKEFLPVNTTPRSCSSWITFSPSEFTLKPFSRQKVNYEIKVPQGAKSGHYSALFFESMFGRAETVQGQMSAGMNLAVRIAVLFYVEPSGTTQRIAEISNLTVQKEGGRLSISADFQNTGTVDITAGGTCDIIDKKGMVYSRGAFNTVYTFPGSTVRVNALLNSPVPPGSYDMVLTFDLGKALEEYNLGRGPVMTKEAALVINDRRGVASVGKLR